MTPTQTQIEIKSSSPTCVIAQITDSQPSLCELLHGLSPAEREQLVRDVWGFGSRAVTGVWAQAQEARLGEVGADDATLETGRSSQKSTNVERPRA